MSSTVALLSDALCRANEPDEQRLSPTTVLAVEDDAVSSRALVVTLNRANLKANSVQDQFKAIELPRKKAFDVAILDINLHQPARHEQNFLVPENARTASAPEDSGHFCHRLLGI
jgi:ActR/RegA family two-component response regulator